MLKKPPVLRPGADPSIGLLQLEGLAVGALVHGGVGLVGANQNALQAAIVGAVTVVAAVGDGALDGLVGVVASTAHGEVPPVFWVGMMDEGTKRGRDKRCAPVVRTVIVALQERCIPYEKMEIKQKAPGHHDQRLLKNRKKTSSRLQAPAIVPH
jgi:hypothetical protein